MEASVNEALERKCPFFWRLEELWGTRPNTTVIVNAESSTASTSQVPPQAPPQASSPTPSQSTIPDA